MNLYISDLHFGHKNVITFDNRPYADIDEMDQCLIANWNARVAPADHVYIIGDFAYRADKPEEWYLKQLAGHKHLVIGNHDKRLLDNEKAMKYFETVDKMMYIHDEGEKVYMCHYPMAEWNASRHGSWLIYGHIHGNKDEVYDFMATRERALNAAACVNNYIPVSFKELIINNRQFQLD